MVDGLAGLGVAFGSVRPGSFGGRGNSRGGCPVPGSVGGFEGCGSVLGASGSGIWISLYYAVQAIAPASRFTMQDTTPGFSVAEKKVNLLSQWRGDQRRRITARR